MHVGATVSSVGLGTEAGSGIALTSGDCLSDFRRVGLRLVWKEAQVSGSGISCNGIGFGKAI